MSRGCSSVGRALEWHSRGQEFNSPQLHQKFFGLWPGYEAQDNPALMPPIRKGSRLHPLRGCSSVGRALEWHSRGQEFNSPQLHQKFFGLWPGYEAQDNPALMPPIRKGSRLHPLRGCSSVGRALEWHSRGQEFNSPQLHQKTKGCPKGQPFLFCCYPPGRLMSQQSIFSLKCEAFQTTSHFIILEKL